MIANRQAQKLRKYVMSLMGMALFFCVFMLPVSYLRAQSFEDDASQDLVLAVYTSKQKLSEGVFAVEQNARYYLPVATLAEILGFYADVDLERRSVEGWIMSEDDKFSVDTQAGTITAGGRSAVVSKDSFLQSNVADDDVYVALDVFNQIWPIQLDINLSSLILRVTADGKLPFEELIERRVRQKKLQEERELALEQEEVELPFLAYPYQLIGKPSVDIAATTGFDAPQGQLQHSLSFNGVQDLGYASADYSLNLRQNGGDFTRPQNLRLRFQRDNIHEGALPFGLAHTEWGDTRVQQRDLVDSGASGRGLSLSTKEKVFDSEFDVITVDGVGTPGWEVELYINDELIDFGVVDATGIYRFEDVSIGYGNNNVRTVLYGPQGEVREKTESYFYRSNMVKKGENEFTFGVVDQNKDLIPIEKRDINEVEGVNANLYAARGVSDKLTMFASAGALNDRVAQDDIARRYVTAGAIASFDQTLAQAEVYKQMSGGEALDIKTLSDFKGFKVNTKTAFYRDFESPDAADGVNAKQFEFEFDVKKTFATALGNLGLDVGVEHLKREDGQTSTTYTTRQSLGVKGTRFTNQTRSNVSDRQHVATSGRLSSTSRMNQWSLRNSLNYETFPDVKGTSFQTELRYGRNRKYSGALRLQRNFQSQENLVGVQLTKDFKKFLGSVDADWSSQSGASLMFRASTAFGPYGPDGSYIMQSDPMRNLGPISAFAYRDLDYDGVYSDGDVPEPDAKISIGRRITKQETDENGNLVEMSSTTNQIIDVGLGPNSIDDPYVMPASKGYSIYPRSGVMHRLEFPVIETGAIDGSVRWSSRKPIAGLILELMNEDAEIVKKSKTATDGYFTFERIPPGSYTIRAAAESGVNVPFEYVELTPDNLFVFGVTITVDDLSDVQEVDLDIGVDQEGVMKVENILSLAKGAKSQKGANLTKAKSKSPLTEEVLSGGSPAKNLVKVSASGSKTPATITALRIGEHPDKLRVVLDLSAQTTYSLDYDPTSNSIFVEMPYASWSASKEWKSKKADNIVKSYHVEQTDTGIRLVLSVKEGVAIGASGLLKADGDKKDRLYLDIARK